LNPRFLGFAIQRTIHALTVFCASSVYKRRTPDFSRVLIDFKGVHAYESWIEFYQDDYSGL